MARRFPASFDKMAQIITVGVIVLLASVIAMIWIVPDDNDGLGAKVFPTVLMSLIVVIAYAFSPRAFSVTSDAVVVHRIWENAKIPLGNITSVRKIERVSSKGLIRTLGNGGLFGYYGDFRNSEFGDMEWYLSRRRNLILIETGKSKILISPDDVDGFLQVLTSVQADKFNKMTT